MAMIMRWLWTFMNKFQGALTHLVFERERESCFPSGRWPQALMTQALAWWQLDLVPVNKNLICWRTWGKNTSRILMCLARKGRVLSGNMPWTLPFVIYQFYFFSTVGSLKGTVLHIDSNQGPGPTDIVGELLWPQIVLPEDGTGCGHIAIWNPAGQGWYLRIFEMGNLWQIQVSQCCKTMMFV